MFDHAAFKNEKENVERRIMEMISKFQKEYGVYVTSIKTDNNFLGERYKEIISLALKCEL